MSTSRDTMQQLMVNMRKAFDDIGSKGLQENRRLFDMTGLHAALPPGITVQSEAVNGSLTGDWLMTADEDSNSPIVLYFHGGGYSVGSSISHRPLCARLAFHSACRVFSLNYRLAPEHKYPAALEDALSAYQWLRQKYPASKIFIAGDSAGGGLVMAALLAIKWAALPQPTGAVGLSAWLDLECTSASYAENKAIDLMASAEGLRFVGRAYAGKKISTDPLVSPFYATELHGLCPLLLQVGEAETLRDENIVFAEKAKTAGLDVEIQIWPNMVHVWHSLYGEIPEAQAALEAIGIWIQQH